MATQKFANDASALLAVSINAAATSVQVASGGGALFPAIGAGEYVMLAIENAVGDIEFVKATARSGDVFTVTRAQEGSTARSFTASQARVELRLTKETMERLVQHDAGVVNMDLTIPNLTVQTTLTGAAANFSGNVTIGGTLGVTGALSAVTGSYSTSLTVASVSVRDATLFNTGTLADARLSSNIPRLNTSTQFTAALSTTSTFVATGNITGGAAINADRIYSGYDSGISGCLSASNWFRSNGSTGWYNETHQGGIYMEDTTFVRVAGGKSFHSSANIVAVGDVTAYYSDDRLKTRQGNIDQALDKVRALDGFFYVENDLAKSFGYDNSEVQVGLSAQKLLEVLPQVVSLAPMDIEVRDGKLVSRSGENYLTANYAKVVPLLIEAIKELADTVDKLKAEKT